MIHNDCHQPIASIFNLIIYYKNLCKGVVNVSLLIFLIDCNKNKLNENVFLKKRRNLRIVTELILKVDLVV